MNAYIILDNGSGEIAREPVDHDRHLEPDAIREAIERLVADVAVFHVGDTIKVIEG